MLTFYTPIHLYTLQFSNLRKLNIFSIIAENIKLANDKGRQNRAIA